MFKTALAWINAVFDVFLDWLSGNSEDDDREMDDGMHWHY